MTQNKISEPYFTGFEVQLKTKIDCMLLKFTITVCVASIDLVI